MHLREQEYVIAIDRYRNITQAAKTMGISQPAMTHFLNQLESDLDVKLFDRGAKPLKLTAAGELYVNNARQMLNLKEQFEKELQALKRQDLCQLRIGIQQIRAPHLVPPLTLAIRQEFHGLKVIFYESHGKSLFEMLRKGEIDLLLHNKMEEIPGITSEVLMQDKLLLITPEDHPLNRSQIRGQDNYPWMDLSLFRNENFLLMPVGYTLREHAERLFFDQGWRPKEIELYSRTETILHLVSAGAGVSLVLESYLPYFNLKKRISCFLVGDPPERVDYMAFYQEKLKAYPIFDRFLELIRFVIPG
ncbi:MAG: LysR family transcriptional regulator [Hungatella sp.]|nr:LysR family transcriptional regulator [Hungatella sp.]